MLAIASNLQALREQIPSGTELVCVSKFHSTEEIFEAYCCGERIFGESRVQELISKEQSLPKDIKWHFIGHLQTNKVKYIAPFITLIHAVDSLVLLNEINRCGKRINRRIDILLQVHIAREEHKFGFLPQELLSFLSQQTLVEFPYVHICGFMGMATFTNDREQIEQEFRELGELFREAKLQFFHEDQGFCQLSMGMSEDFLLAMKHGSTLIRIGSAIFGERSS